MKICKYGKLENKKNSIVYRSKDDLSTHSRRKLSDIKDFLERLEEFEESKKIEKYLGKIIKIQDVPRLIPTGNYNVTTSLDYLKDTINRYVEEFGLDLNPDFQRHHAWSMEQRIAYVEFILQGGKSNPIYFNCEGWMGNFSKTMVIVDGKQRLSSLLMFLNNEFPVFKNLDNNDNVGFYAKEFNRMGANIEVVINDLPDKKSVLLWYLQINKGQVAHTEEELNKVENLLKAELKKG